MSCFSQLFKPDPSDLADRRAQVNDLIKNNAVVVFAKSYCPYCAATKALLKKNGARFYSIDLDRAKGGSDIKAVLQQMTGQTSVPNIFIGGQHIGGNSDLQARKRELPQMLSSVGALR